MIVWVYFSGAPDNVAYQSVDVKPPAAATSAGAAKVTDAAVPSGSPAKRNIIKRSCEVQPAGAGPTSTPDTAEAFLADPQYNAIASSASTPAGYKLAFSQLQGSSQTTSYLGYKTMESYDTEGCAFFCDQQEGCIAFNLYLERDPTVDPGSNCTNPASTTNFKCVKWGVQISDKTATNIGQYRQNFHVVVSGSNGYNTKLPPPRPPATKAPRPSPAPSTRLSTPPPTRTPTWATSTSPSTTCKTFANGVIACTSACSAQTKYNAAHPPASGPPAVCNQAVVYVLNDNGAPQGIYCSMYTEAWASAYATNVGQYRGQDYWSVTQAYAFTTASYAAKYQPICAVDGCPAGSYRGGITGLWGWECDGCCEEIDEKDDD
ncbi:hypothetical protein DID88_009346 [Monilinia fructigena]|uniref:Apple domain-containing protein n=1 Tax=Monilinia fructigena TaxID=38457 RepID=A0A395IMT4_9HELO|nr:hypothetical protein DID88_009346 [Monilinia fructigena]